MALYARKAESILGIVPIENGGTGASTTATAKVNLGLELVDNTSDLNKPLSQATQNYVTQQVVNVVQQVQNVTQQVENVTQQVQNVTQQVENVVIVDASTSEKGKIQLAGDLSGTAAAPTVPGLALKANIDSPTFTGAPLAPTAAAGTSTAQIATTAFVATAISIGGSGGGSGSGPSANLTGDVTSSGNATTIGANKVTTGMIVDGAVTNADLANIASKTFKGRTSSSIGAVEDLTVAQVKTDLAINNIDNTTDLLKPVSTATQSGLDLKSNLVSPTFTGTPTLPTGTIGFTQTAGNNTTAVATTAFVTNAVTSGTIADADASTKGKIQLAGELAGTAALPTVTNAAVITKVLTGFSSAAGAVAATDNVLEGLQKIDGNVALKANLASPTFTGTPTLPTGTTGVTQAAGNNTTALATTAYADAVATAGTPDATASVKGKIQLAGELAGTAALPTVTNAAVITKVLTGFSSAAGTVAATDNVLQGFGKIDGNVALKAPLASPTFTGTVTIPTPFTLGATSVTATGTQLNYINTATGTTGTNTTNIVYSTSPTLVTPVIGAATGTSLSVSGQLSSTVAIGTAPLMVVSTTEVANLRAATATNLAAGLGGTIPYQSAAGTTVMLANGTAGQVLRSNGTTLAPTWVSGAPVVREVADQFNATAAQTSFTLTQTPSVNSKVKMYINGIRISNAAYSVSGTTLTYLQASNGGYVLVSNDRIQFDYYY